MSVQQPQPPPWVKQTPANQYQRKLWTACPTWRLIYDAWRRPRQFYTDHHILISRCWQRKKNPHKKSVTRLWGTVNSNITCKNWKQVEYCCESTVLGKWTHWVLQQARWVLRKTRWVRFGTQIIGWEELAELSPCNCRWGAKKFTEFGVWSHALRNRIGPVSKKNGQVCGSWFNLALTKVQFAPGV